MNSTSKARLRADRLAKWTVTTGGLAIIASILGILVFLLIETWPLVNAAKVGDLTRTAVDSNRIIAVIPDAYGERTAFCDVAGRVRVVAAGGKAIATRDLLAGIEPRPVVTGGLAQQEGRGFAIATSDGRVVYQLFSWKVGFEGTKRVVDPNFGDRVVVDVDPDQARLRAWTATSDADDVIGVAARSEAGKLYRCRVDWEENAITETREASVARSELQAAGDVAELTLSADLRNLWALDSQHHVVWWHLAEGGTAARPQRVAATGEPCRLGLLFGETSLIVGGTDGTLSQWFASRRGSRVQHLTRVREFEPMPGAVARITASRRNKGFIAADSNGNLAAYYATTGVRSWTSRRAIGAVDAIAFTPKDDGIIVAQGGELLRAPYSFAHPEATAASLFTKVWYEGYDEPTHTWESTGGTDDFETKLGIVPLVFGTLKGTVFAMLISVPLAVLGAMFVSQFMHPSLRSWIKPTIEIMAAMPSVILGFVAGLWLAPTLEAGFVAFLLMPVVLPLVVIAAGALWTRRSAHTLAKYPMGFEAILFVGVLAAGVAVCVLLGNPVEDLVFGGDFAGWVRDSLGLDYAQKNSVVIAIAMSFAVIPIIFSISEDAFSNVPRNLLSGSLALGADRWQTVTRVVLPTASPGIFSATMIGFGRAIGETMIVLMATGNTAIMDWNPFNGFRTLSANIATEIPEAPQGGTLYRTLFLTALLLYGLTFLINTIAESVRQRLRLRYATL